MNINKLNSSRYLLHIFLLLLTLCIGCGQKKTTEGMLINDISKLNPTYVKDIMPARHVDSLQKAVLKAQEMGLKISISGRRHSLGGHAFYPDAVVLDMTYFNQILNLDIENKVITVQSGVSWEQIQEHINPHNLSIKSMQSSNIFTVGGSMSSNIHGRDPHNSLIVDTILDFRLLLPNGEIVNVNREDNPDLFKLVIGGYGLFGVIIDVSLQLTNNHILKKESRIMDYSKFSDFFHNHIIVNPDIELFIARPSIAPSSLMGQTVVTTWKNTHLQKTLPDKIFKLTKESNVRRDKFFFGWSRKSNLGKEVRWWLQKRLDAKVGKQDYVTRNNAMRPPTTPLKFLDYDSDKDTDIIQEYFIPVDKFSNFLDGAREIVQREKINLLGVTVRYIKKNDHTFLSYAKKNIFSIVMYTNQKLSKNGIEKAKKMTKQLVNLSLQQGGLYYLTYQLFPTQEQIRLAYPKIDQFFDKKRLYDPQELFLNKFYQQYAGQMEGNYE